MKKKALNKNYYWTKDIDNSITNFNTAATMKKRNDIFENELQIPFKKLVEYITNTFKFSYFEEGAEKVQIEVLDHLVSQLDKFKTSKGKSFGYFSIIAKNYLIQLNNKNYKNFCRHLAVKPDGSLDLGPNHNSSNNEENIKLTLPELIVKTDKDELKKFKEFIIYKFETNIDEIFDGLSNLRNKQRCKDICRCVINLIKENNDEFDHITMSGRHILNKVIKERVNDVSTNHIKKCVDIMRKHFYNIIVKEYFNE